MRILSFGRTGLIVVNEMTTCNALREITGGKREAKAAKHTRLRVLGIDERGGYRDTVRLSLAS